MASLAIGGISGLLMVRCFGIVILRQVTIGTHLRRTCILAIFVAIGAYRGLVFAVQGKLGMIQFSSGPGGGTGTMTYLTIRGIPGVFMVGCRSGIIIVQMATGTIPGCGFILTIHMAISTPYRDMGTQ